nr:hypothetical protein [Tanacetum cinerariifolium]
KINPPYEAVQIIPTGIDNDIYSTVDVCPNACEMWKVIERLKQAGSKDRPPMLAPGNYIQWKSRIKRYIDTKPNRDLSHFCLTNPPYELGWKDKPILDSEGDPTTATQQVFETFKNVPQEIIDQLNAEAEAVQIILTGIDNDIYSTVDACPNACEMWKAIERLKQDTSKDKEIDKLMALISLSFKKIYKPTNNNLRTSSNTSRANQDNSPRIHRSAWYKGHRSGTVAGARETVDAQNVLIESEDMNYNSEQIDQNEEDVDLAKERELLASLIAK